ncbi:MAG: gamma-glutamyl-gamma-aminobutyrate hydrolase family protein [Firmicutes bacterium]|nr:gamma-glutamyl-gamma-aminobutyrate hydrolase family protein [Bacillota bacterium]
MNKRPVIGLTTDFDQERQGHLIFNSYVESIRKAGGVPLLLMPTVRTPENWSGDRDEFLKLFPVEEEIFELLDGVLFTGGADVDPQFYGEQPTKDCGGYFPFRDALEINLAKKCIEKDLPVLGICRGIQSLACAMGAKLTQDIYQEDTHFQHGQKVVNWYPAHKVKTKEGSLLFRMIGEEAWVNSFHHQSVLKNQPPYPFDITAWSEDGLIEGIEKPEQFFFVGVQWHPERMITDPKMRGLFETFVKACAERHQGA